MNSLKDLINEERGKLIVKKHDFDKKYDLDCTVNYYLKDNGKIYGYNKDKLFFEANYQVIGTVNEKNCFFRWAWSNPSIPEKSLEYAKKMIKYGEDKRIPQLLNTKLKGKTFGFKCLVLGAHINDDCETYVVYKKPRTTLMVYMLIRNSRKPRISHKKLMNNEINTNNK